MPRRFPYMISAFNGLELDSRRRCKSAGILLFTLHFFPNLITLALQKASIHVRSISNNAFQPSQLINTGSDSTCAGSSISIAASAG